MPKETRRNAVVNTKHALFSGLRVRLPLWSVLNGIVI